MTYRPEAGQRPPLRPIELTSSTTAPLSRERSTQQIPFSTVLSAVAEELQNVSRAMPNKKRLSWIGIHSMNIASGNSIRTDHFMQTFPGVGIHRKPGTEAHRGDAFEDAKSKAMTSAEEYRAYRHTPKSFLRRLRIHNREEWFKINPFNGPDALNAIPQANNDGSFAGLVRLGKPERETAGREAEATQERFKNLAKLAETNNWQSVPYVVEQASYIHSAKRRDTKHDAHSIRRAVILLDPQGLAYLATPEGFTAYQEEVAKTSPTLGQTAGGMKIEAFKNLGIIQGISHNSEEVQSMKLNPNQEAEYRYAEQLALGKFDVPLLLEWQGKFPKTLRQRFSSKKN